MELATVRINQVDAIFVAKGPGGFSALRVGLSVAKALAMARAVPLVGVGTLVIEARPYLGLGMPVCAVIEAGQAMVYAGTYRAPPAMREDTGLEYRAETCEDLVSSAQTGTLFCGEAVGSVAEMLRAKLGSAVRVVDVAPPTRRPSVLAQLGYQRLAASQTDDPELLQPIYIRGSQFEVAQRGRQIKVTAESAENAEET
jgi:tRNA threonylcarbamoyladenosine biosynthesis protein TsaB